MTHAPMAPGPHRSRAILGVRVDATSYDDATARILTWALAGESRYACACNVHMVMEAHDDPSFRDVVNGADLVTPDGVPLVWTLRRLGVEDATRVYGPDLMLSVLAGAEKAGVPVGLYGSTPETLEALVPRLAERFPGLDLAYVCAPPQGPPGIDAPEVEAMERAGVRILFVALGCPKQERWMAMHRGRLRSVMIGVGAAFDFIAGSKRQAPGFLQRAGLEWLFRLATEPRRLARRYLAHNPRFVALLARELALARSTDHDLRASDQDPS